MYDELVKDLRDNHDKYFARDMQAADAIEQLMEDNAALNETVTNLLEQIKDLSKPRWIPVTERLPEAGVYVLAYSADDDYMTVEARHKFEAFQITHWMPLPQPPKEEIE